MGRAAVGFSVVDKWGIPEREEFFALGRAIRGDDFEVFPCEFLCVFQWVCDCCGGKNDLWAGVVVATYSKEAANKHGDVGTEDTAVNVGFVDYDEL